jgi:hypothetical protein
MTWPSDQVRADLLEHGVEEQCCDGVDTEEGLDHSPTCQRHCIDCGGTRVKRRDINNPDWTLYQCVSCQHPVWTKEEA